MRRIALVCLALLAVPHLRLDAQDRPDVPPIPSQEQLRPRSDLEVTLRITPDRVPADQTPAITLVLRNTGRDRLLIPPYVHDGINVRTRSYRASGDEIVPTVTSIIDRSVRPSSVHALLVLEPQEARELPLSAAADRPSGYAVGEYQLQVTYYSFADAALLYDVYEDGADQAWEGEIVTPRVSFTVLPLDADVERRLIARVEDPSDPQVVQAASVLALGRSRDAVAPLVRRFEADPSSRLAITVALAGIGDSEGIGQLARVIDRLPPSERGGAFSMLLRSRPSTPEALVLQSRECEGLPILLHLLPPGTDEYRRAAASLDERCPTLRSRLRAVADAAHENPTTPEGRELASRASRAESLLREIDSPSTPEPPVQALAQIPASEPPPDDRPAPVRADGLAEYVRTVVEAPSGSSLDDELYGIALFGRASTFLELRAALDVVTDDRREQVAYALQALTFTANDQIREQHLHGGHWDAWWMAHGGRSRREWALDALEVPAPPWQGMAWWHAHSDASNALAHLARLADPPRQILDGAETHRSWRVRVAAALAVAETDLARGVHLLMRELDNRYVAACQEAVKTLSQLVPAGRRFSCHRSAERAAAVQHWTDAVRAVPR